MPEVLKDYFTYSSGFMDYRFGYTDVKLIFTIIGTIVCLVNSLAFIPETYELVSNRTNFGLSSSFVYGNSIGQFLLIINFLCLNSEEFCGIFSYNFHVTFSSLLTFFTLFGQWILFLPVVFLTLNLDDREFNKHDTQSEKFWNKFTIIGLVILNIVSSMALLFIWGFLGNYFDFSSIYVRRFGELCGIISSVLEVFQAFPQIYTTIKIRGNGSLSLLMLQIQGPSALFSAFYMAFALNESFTTYLMVLIEGASQITLLCLSLFFKYCGNNEKTDIDYTTLQMKLLNPLDPVI